MAGNATFRSPSPVTLPHSASRPTEQSLRWHSLRFGYYKVDIQLGTREHHSLQGILRDRNLPINSTNTEIHRLLGVTGYAERIVDLHVTGPNVRDFNKEPDSECNLPNLINQAYVLHNLRRLTVLNVPIFVWCHLIPTQLIALDCSRTSSVAHPRIAMSEFMKVLRHLRQLEELTVHEALYLDVTHGGTVRQLDLPNLKKLDVALHDGRNMDNGLAYKTFMDYFPKLDPSVLLSIRTLLTREQLTFLNLGSLFTSPDPFYKFKVIGTDFRRCTLQAWSKAREHALVPSFEANLTMFLCQHEAISWEVTTLCKQLPRDTVKKLVLEWKVGDPKLYEVDPDHKFFKSTRHTMAKVEYMRVVSQDRGWQISLTDGLAALYWPRLRKLEFAQVDANALHGLQTALNVHRSIRRVLNTVVIGDASFNRQPDGFLYLPMPHNL